MNINLTLIIQMIVFATLVWFTMKFVWPMILGPLQERQRKIATGLAAAEQGQHELAQAEERAQVLIREARERAGQIIDQAQRRANELIEQARNAANAESQRIVAGAQAEIELETRRARENLRKDVAQLAVQTAAKVLEREVDAKAHTDLIRQLAARI